MCRFQNIVIEFAFLSMFIAFLMISQIILGQVLSFFEYCPKGRCFRVDQIYDLIHLGSVILLILSIQLVYWLIKRKIK